MELLKEKEIVRRLFLLAGALLSMLFYFYFTGEHPKEVFPLKEQYWIPLSVGIVLYFILPKAKKPKGALGFKASWSMIITDFLALVFMGFFFVMPMVMVNESYDRFSELFSFQDSWAWLTIFMWFIASLFLGLLWSGAWRMSYWITIKPHGLEHHTLASAKFYAFQDIKKASVDKEKKGCLMAAFHTLGKRRPYETYDDVPEDLSGLKGTGIGITMNNQEYWWIKMAYFEDPHKLVQVLADNGVKLDKELERAWEKKAKFLT